MDPVAVLESLGSVARRRHLLAVGLTDRDLMAAVASGAVRRPHRGCFALPDATWSAVKARVLSSQLTCLSALRPLGLPCIETYEGLHLAIPAHRGFVVGDTRLREGMRFHTIEDPPGLSLTAPITTVLDHLGLCAAPLTQLAAVDAALHEGRMSMPQLASFTATPLRQRLWLQAHAEPLTQSPRETKARVELTTAGLAVVAQAALPGVGHVDFLVEGVVVVECDGFTYHGDEEAFLEDRRRDRACELLGLGRLRYTGTEVEQSQGRIATDVKRMLNARTRQSRV
jgi:very-short-patch-repair endonuclease